MSVYEVSALAAEDIRWCITRLPIGIRPLMKAYGPRIMLAGGFIRAIIAHEEASDVDLFVRSVDDARLFANELVNKTMGRIITTDNAFTVVGKGNTAVQFIHRWTYNQPIDILPSFDFTIAKAVIWFDGVHQGYCDTHFYSDLAAKRLVYTSPVRIEEVGGSLLRVLKFYRRGYTIPMNSLAAVIARLNSGIKGSIESEEWCSTVILGLLREVDPLGAYMPEVMQEDEEPTTTA